VIESYIITVKGNNISESLSKRCQDSFNKIGVPFNIWEAYDGTSGNIVLPNNHPSWMDWIRVTSSRLSSSEIACALSHISLWGKCLDLKKPIAILEHDVLIKEPLNFDLPNLCICNLFRKDQGLSKHPLYNFGSMNGTHAYAIHPDMALKLISYVLQEGIYAPIDVMLRNDKFQIYNQKDFFDLIAEETIVEKSFF
jgi:GR25 family glycosyltransferase involved in LPS biosynthesis